MQNVKNYPEIKQYSKKALFSSFFINSIINIIFITTSCYTYFVINTLTKTQNIISILTPTITIIILYAFCYALIVKRDNIINGLGRFIDYLIFNDIIKIGVIINARTNSKIPAKSLMNDISVIKQFITQKNIIGLFDFPWILISCAIICYFSITNLIICLTCILLCLLLVLVEKKYYRQYNQTKIKEGYDFINELFENSNFIRCNFDFENIIRNTATENTKIYEENSILTKKISFYNSVIRFFISFSQVLIFLISIIFVLVHNFTFGEFILTIILSNKIFNMVNNSLNSVVIFSNVKQSFNRINDAMQKTYNLDLLKKPNIADELSIELKDVSYTNYITQQETFSNINGKLYGGEIYVVNSYNEEKNTTFLNLLAGIFRPSNGRIINNKINNESHFSFFLPKEPFLLRGSILENISGFEERPDVVKIMSIIKSLDIYNEISKLKYDLDTILTSKKDYNELFIKKINLATMIYQNSDVVILEEPFEILDDNSASYLVDFINTNKKLGKMTILSAIDIENKYIDKLNSINIIDFK